MDDCVRMTRDPKVYFGESPASNGRRIRGQVGPWCMHAHSDCSLVVIWLAGSRGMCSYLLGMTRMQGFREQSGTRNPGSVENTLGHKNVLLMSLILHIRVNDMSSHSGP